MRHPVRRLLIVAVILGVIAGGAVYGLHKITHTVATLFPPAQECTATVEGHTVALAPTQAENAALITAISVERGLPAHAATIALATAMQESKLYNLSGGDRDSVGLFQQRPSQGWGSAAEISDPVYATNKFYDALVKLPDFQNVTVTEAAQAVQHSAYPNAYAAHEADARVLASALTGYSPHAFWCHQDAPTSTAHASSASSEIASMFGVHGVVRGQVLSFPVTDATTAWAIAQYLVAQGPRFDYRSVAYDGWRWSTGTDGQWTSGATAAAAPAGQVSVRLS